jgi:hypothetical protein
MSVAESNAGNGNVLRGMFGARRPEADTPPAPQTNEQLRVRLLTPPEVPTWGPSGVKTRLKRLQRAQLVPHGLKSAMPSVLRGRKMEEDEQIVENLELHRRVFNYRWYYVGAALFSLAIAALALFVDYHIIEADVWTRALADEFGVVPASLEASVVYKSLQVVFATLAIHFMLKITGSVGRTVLVIAIFILSFVMVSGLGFIVANNNLAAGASGVRSIEGGGDARLGDALSQLGLAGPSTTAPAAAAPAAPLPDIIERGASSRCPTGYNRMEADPSRCQRVGTAEPFVSLDLQDWFVFRSLPEEWRKNAQANLWLIFASLIFFIITAVAALYIDAAERNVRNFIEANDYRHRERDYRAYRVKAA